MSTHVTTTPTISVEGKRVLITGASRGIGRALAHGFAKDGAEVLCLARASEDLSSLESELKNEGRRVRTLAVDLMEANFKAILEHLGPIDVLIHSAGLARHSSIQDVSQEGFDAVMALNVRVPLLL